jgi:hypothetical protein
VYDFGNVEDDTFSFIKRIHLHEEIAKEAQRKEVNSRCSAALQIDHLRDKESIYSLFWGAVNLESYIGPEAVQRYERLVDLSAKLKMQQVDPDLIIEDYNSLTISEIIRRCQEKREKSETYQFVYPVVGRKLFITSLGFTPFTGIGVPTV